MIRAEAICKIDCDFCGNGQTINESSYELRNRGMIKAKSIYQVSCDRCITKTITVETTDIEFALIVLRQRGWKVEIDNDGCIFWTLCPECAREGETDGDK